MPPRGNIRDEVVAVAMRQFVERGYDQTSLREIADEIGVTKAALYYHFRSKDDIARAALSAHAERVGAILDWLESTGPGAERDAELVRRLQDLFEGESALAMRFGQVNPTVISREEFGEAHVGQIKRLVGLITDGYSGTEPEIRAVLAFGAMLIGALDSGSEAGMVTRGSRSERRAAGGRIALEILAGIRGGDA